MQNKITVNIGGQEITFNSFEIAQCYINQYSNAQKQLYLIQSKFEVEKLKLQEIELSKLKLKKERISKLKKLDEINLAH